jgi:hypothetical protein
MKQIKIFFDDYGRHFDKTEETILTLLRRSYNVVIDPCCDYLFFSSGGYNHFLYPHHCIKIFYTCENAEPDFNLCDYALAHSRIQLGDRYFRAPYYRFSRELEHIDCRIPSERALKRKFCNFLSSSGWADPVREEFFQKLSAYKRVDSGGRILNNMGRRIKNKMAFISDYKFTIAFENSVLPGYTTEKIVEAMAANSLPLYWGNPDAGKDFNKAAFVCINDFDTLDAAVDEIIRLDNDDEAYLRKLAAPRCLEPYHLWEEQLFLFLKHIFDQSPDKAKRVAGYGFQYAYRRDLSALKWLFGKNKFIAMGLRKLLRLLLTAKKAH